MQAQNRHNPAPASRATRASSLPALAAALLLAACASTAPQQGAAPAAGPASLPAAPAAAAPAGTSREEAALRNLVDQQDRLYRVAAPLLVNNSDLCRKNARNLLGFTAKNKYSYSADFVRPAEKLFGMNDSLKVMGVLEGSGAAKAGLRRGDDLISIEDRELPRGDNAERQAATILGPLITGRSSVRMLVSRNGSSQPLTVPLTYACAFGIELGNSDNVNAYDDGFRVLITRGMLNAVGNDEELAYVIAKEMAHNILMHASRQRMSATAGGIIDNLIRLHPDMTGMAGMAGLKAMPQELDATADRLSLYLLARAGYSIDGTASFWQRMATQYPASMLNAYTALHPATAYRVAAMQKTAVDVKTKKAARKPLMP
ncbi:Peptidase family M48 [Noviherbaspirillum humi]|uniref:Peptidase family M48 n=1 Tax=Noviherbaspirillum humi TaxID=1688639 RepID=A0A239GKW4_9BURK|nr:M48 family metallopeptidase [Noviherbaspirillum humi]SNS69418.1 Peptidase family M48 [Noviherbaspirillum humi]